MNESATCWEQENFLSRILKSEFPGLHPFESPESHWLKWNVPRLQTCCIRVPEGGAQNFIFYTRDKCFGSQTCLIRINWECLFKILSPESHSRLMESGHLKQALIRIIWGGRVRAIGEGDQVVQASSYKGMKCTAWRIQSIIL